MIVILFCITNYATAQTTRALSPFKGFHIGITGQAEFIQPCSFTALTGSDPAPKAVWTKGWEAGVELSYHFAKYFGVSLGFNYGTSFSYNADTYFSTVPDFEGGWEELNRYERSYMEIHETHYIYLAKLEFHYPMYKNLFFTTEAGVKIKGVWDRLLLPEGSWGSLSRGVGYSISPPHTAGDEMEYIEYYNDYGEMDLHQIHCDLLLGLGLYYQLPYGDLLRFTTGVNISFKPIINGYYQYYLTDSYGTFTVKNDFFYTQLSYIHTFNFEKAKRYLKKSGQTFTSKKERRSQILNMLNGRL